MDVVWLCVFIRAVSDAAPVVALVSAPPMVTESPADAAAFRSARSGSGCSADRAWTLQLLIDYPLVAHFCFPEAARRSEPTIDSLRLLILLTSAIALLVAVLALDDPQCGVWRVSGGDAPRRSQGLHR